MNLNKVIDTLTSSGIAGGFAGGMAGGVLANALAGKKGGKHAKTLLKAGGLAAVGGLAWKAYQSYQQSSQQGAQLTDVPHSEFEIETQGEAGSRGVLLVRAMIAAAMSDGHLDVDESARILRRIDELKLDADEKALVTGELLNPASMDELIGQISDQPTAIEVYAASLMAIDRSAEQGRRYLTQLGERLSLPPLLIESLHRRVAMAPLQAA
jgi:uncharacterized membrane protein YebE (DUF533 family)